MNNPRRSRGKYTINHNPPSELNNYHNTFFKTFLLHMFICDYILLLRIKTIFNKFLRPHSFNSAEIDTVSHLIKLKDHHGFVFEIDYEGHQTNRVAYENQVLREGSVYDKLWIYESKANDIKNKDENYLYLLIQALDDENASYGFGKDMLYRKIGEYYEAAGDISKTIENWEKALVINPKVGIKRKFDVLKKRIQPTNRSG